MTDETHPFPTDDEARAMTEPLTLKLKLPEKSVSTPTVEDPNLGIGNANIGETTPFKAAIPSEPEKFSFDAPKVEPAKLDREPFDVTKLEVTAKEVYSGPERRTEMLRYNQGKPRYSLIPPSFTYYTAMVLEYGALKYSADNWRKGGKWNDTLDSLQRHLDSFRAGEDCDVESGLPHLAHMAFNVMALIEFFDKGIGTDDRYRYADQTPGERATGRLLAFRRPPGRE